MKKLALLLALWMLLGLAACGADPAESGEEAPGRSMPAAEEAAGETAPSDALDAVPEPSDKELDLSLYQKEEAFREIEHMNLDPTGYVGLRLRVSGQVSVFESHDKTFYYVSVRDEDGCVENLELRFPGDGSLPAGFPGDGGFVSVTGRVETYEVSQGEERRLCPVLADAEFIPLPDFRD